MIVGTGSPFLQDKIFVCLKLLNGDLARKICLLFGYGGRGWSSKLLLTQDGQHDGEKLTIVNRLHLLAESSVVLPVHGLAS
jgi:hypothetical protein